MLRSHRSILLFLGMLISFAGGLRGDDTIESLKKEIAVLKKELELARRERDLLQKRWINCDRARRPRRAKSDPRERSLGSYGRSIIFAPMGPFIRRRSSWHQKVKSITMRAKSEPTQKMGIVHEWI